jgi:type VI secretion system protein ImpJ
MSNRPVHWHEGMFLQPHHFQAADQYARHALRESEDWFHPFDWGLRLVDLDRDAIANYTMTLRACEARFKDGSKVIIPGDVVIDPVELKAAFTSSPTVMAYLAVPAFQMGRSNVEALPTADGPRYSVETIEREDENTGGGEQPIQVRRMGARILLSNQDQTGYEVLPICRIERSAQTESPPQVDLSYVPPLLALDAWPALWRAVQSLHHQIGAKIDQLAAQMIDRGVSFDSQVPGDAERLLKLSVLNAAFSFFESVVFVRGLTPLFLYKELCRLVGQLALFSEARRPPSMPAYDHENIGSCFYTVIKYIQLGLDTLAPSSFEKRYFEKLGERLQVTLEPGWLTATRSLFLGVETELSDVECQALLSALDMKMGSGAQVEHIFKRALRGLTLAPVARPPRQLPASTGVIYYQIERDPVFWKEVAESYNLALRMNLTRGQFQGDRVLAVVPPKGTKPTNLQFALYVI